jgi:hypothetical protein
MGKRELLIILAFIVVGTVAYQVTAPPAEPSSRSFSFSDIFNSARREMRGNPASATITKVTTFPAPASLEELRLNGSVTMTVTGEDRSDIECQMTITSNGPDDETAKAWAQKVELTPDELGPTLVVRATFPEEGSQEATLVVRVPKRLAVRVEAFRTAAVDNVASAHVEASRGKVTLTGIAGAVTGVHQDNTLTVKGAGSVKLRLLRLKANFTGVRNGLVLDVRDSEATIAESAGTAEIDLARGEVTMTGHTGEATIRGTDGRVVLDRPAAPATVDVRRTEVEATVKDAVALTLITTDSTARLRMDGTPRLTLDAAAIDGKIQAAEFALTPTSDARGEKLAHTFGAAGGPKVTMRTTGGDVVVRKVS